MKLYDHPASGNAFKITLAASHLGIELENVRVDLLKGEQRTDEFLAKNPDGRVPVLELDDGTCIPESNAILFYLARGSQLRGDDDVEDAQILAWLFFEQNVSEPAFAGLRFWKKFGSPEEGERRRPLLEQNATRALKIMDRYLGGHDYFALGRLTIADISLYVYTELLTEAEFDASGYQNVQAWLARIRENPAHIAYSM